MPVQPIRSTVTGRYSVTVLGPDDLPIAPVESFLAHLDHLNYSPNTVKAYAHDLNDLFAWLGVTGHTWRSLALADVGEWVAWLRLPRPLRGGGVHVLPTIGPAVSERTLQRKIAAVGSFYDFHRRSEPGLGPEISQWVAGARRGGGKGFLAHTQRGARRRQMVVRGALTPLPQIVSRPDLTELLGACRRLRDRFLLTTLFETGMRIGEALGLRHSDLKMATHNVEIVPRENANQARVKGWKPRMIPVNAELFSLYAVYIDEEYGTVDSDYVFVNLWGSPSGQAMTYASVRSLVLRLRRATGLASFTPHQLRHTYATELIRRGTDWGVVQRLLGHANVQTTLDTYGHLTAADARQALHDAGWFDDSWSTLALEDR